MSIKASELKRYVDIRPVVMEGFPDAHHVFLQVTNQSFCVSPHGCETKEMAEWMRDMLCVALAKIVADAGSDTPHEGTK
jgi:hypothetical protein